MFKMQFTIAVVIGEYIIALMTGYVLGYAVGIYRERARVRREHERVKNVVWPYRLVSKEDDK